MVSKTESTGRLHAMIVDYVLEHNGEDEFVPTQDEVTTFYLGLQEEQVVDRKDKSMERTESIVSSIIEIEQLLSKITEEQKQVRSTVNE